METEVLTNGKNGFRLNIASPAVWGVLLVVMVHLVTIVWGFARAHTILNETRTDVEHVVRQVRDLSNRTTRIETILEERSRDGRLPARTPAGSSSGTD